MSSTQIRYLVAVGLSIGLGVLYVVASSWGEMLVIFSDMLFCMASGVCAVLSFMVLRKRGASGVLGAVHRNIFVGMLLWFLGDAAWALYEIGLRVPVPYPSLADVFYLAGYPALAVGAIGLLWNFKELVDRKRVAVSTLLAVSVMSVTIISLLGPLLEESTDLLMAAFDVAYPILDMVVLIPSIFLVLNNPFRGGTLAQSWIWISIGIALTTIADIFFSQGTLAGWYYSGHPVELFYLWGYVSMGLGFQTQRTEL